ncbi:hypothetical protein OHA72_22400 [Dactylosporangium sp. NBC_01737]|uniref:hypothetical protein n=1 Tax=Dactylosporangium sp. NBC_01737 TaxID=2975959 RepID=UPI002E1103FE|nr:hypothetical protein OHA72_22400 [Dactylosporangium sp. NBC_01737]
MTPHQPDARPSLAALSVPETVLEDGYRQWHTPGDTVNDAVRADRVVLATWEHGYPHFYRDAYVDAATRIGDAAGRADAEPAAWVLIYPLAIVASELIGRSAQLPTAVPSLSEAGSQEARQAAAGSREPWRAVAQTVWRRALVEATVAGAYAAGADLTAARTVRSGRGVAQARGFLIDGQPADAWFKATLLAVNRAIIVPGGVPITAAQLAHQDHAPGAPAASGIQTDRSRPEGVPPAASREPRR